eukprot:m.157504 g.157504  ORF g.157504 m.157504 type:complete len:353 (-) comp52960_c0_seq1:1344-2402(-)
MAGIATTLRTLRPVIRHSRALARMVVVPNNANPRILITGSLGQLGSELTRFLRAKHGADNVLASDIRIPPADSPVNQGPFVYADVLDYHWLESLIVDYKIQWVIHLSALLSAIGERNPDKAIALNNGGTQNILELARVHNLRVFSPSTIGAFGPTTPRDNTPDLTIMRPTTIYGITKVYMELMGEYYQKRYGVDFRSLRLPGVISAETPPGGGTTDYAVDIFHHAINHPGVPYSCYLSQDTRLPMVMLSDCISGIVNFLECDPKKLTQRTYNLQAISFTPGEITQAIQRHIPDFTTVYEPEKMRQAIADSWPRYMDGSLATRDWGWQHEYDLKRMTEFMLRRLRQKKELGQL